MTIFSFGSFPLTCSRSHRMGNNEHFNEKHGCCEKKVRSQQYGRHPKDVYMETLFQRTSSPSFSHMYVYVFALIHLMCVCVLANICYSHIVMVMEKNEIRATEQQAWLWEGYNQSMSHWKSIKCLRHCSVGSRFHVMNTSLLGGLLLVAQPLQKISRTIQTFAL